MIYAGGEKCNGERNDLLFCRVFPILFFILVMVVVMIVLGQRKNGTEEEILEKEKRNKR